MKLPESILADSANERQAFLSHPKAIPLFRLLRIIWVAMLFSMGTISFVFFNLARKDPSGRTDNSILLGFGILVGLASLFLPNFLLRNAPIPPGVTDPVEARLPTLMVNYIMRYAFTESALLLLLLSRAALPAPLTYTFLGGALALMAIHFPR